MSPASLLELYLQAAPKFAWRALILFRLCGKVRTLCGFVWNKKPRVTFYGQVHTQVYLSWVTFVQTILLVL